MHIHQEPEEYSALCCLDWCSLPTSWVDPRMVCVFTPTYCCHGEASPRTSYNTHSILIHKVPVPHRLTCLVMLAGTSVCMLASTTDCGREETIFTAVKSA